MIEKYNSRSNINFILIISIIFFSLLSIVNPFHMLPWVSYDSEKYAFISFIILFIYTLINIKKIKLPFILLPFIILFFIPIVQFLLGGIVFFETVFFSSIYLICFLLVMVFSYNLGLENFYKVLNLFCTLFLIISIVSSFIVILQWLNVANFQPWIISLQNTRAFGGIAQPNQMATILIIGLLSLWYFFEVKNKNKNLFIYFALIIIFSIVLTQSRTAYLSIFLIFLFMIVYSKKINFKISRQSISLYFLFFTFCVFILPVLQIGLNKIGLGVIVPNASISERLSTGYERIGLWEHFIGSLLQQPIWGYGWYQTQYANISFFNMNHLSSGTDSAHNIILDIFIWIGIPLGSLFTLYLICLGIIFFKNNEKIEYLIVFLSMMTIFLHALLEYPLFYSYFLLPMGFLIGLSFSLKNRSYIIFNKKYMTMIFLIISYSFYLIDLGYKYNYEKKLDTLIPLRESDKPPILLLNFEKKIIENYIYDRENFILYWIKFNPYSKDKGDIYKLENKILATSTKQALQKYAIYLAYNGFLDKSVYYVDLINLFYNSDIQYNELLDKEKNRNICRFCYK